MPEAKIEVEEAFGAGDLVALASSEEANDATAMRASILNLQVIINDAIQEINATVKALEGRRAQYVTALTTLQYVMAGIK